VKTLGVADEGPDNFLEGRFTVIRRANDISQSGSFIPSPEVGPHKDPQYGTHHARDAAMLFKTLGWDFNIFSSTLKINSQYMHVVHFNIRVRKKVTIENIVDRFQKHPLIALTEKTLTSLVFSFGRDHGHYGRLLNQTVIVLPSLAVHNGTEIVGFCFTPQDGNSILSSIAAATWFLYPDSYQDKIQSLKYLFMQEV
jgi:glyceraldehyde-3-phosphate dehydrogenase (NAD(P))